MEANRVKQILSSSAEIDVKYHGVPIWIDSLNEDETTAIVQAIDNRKLGEKTTVEIRELEE
ncbi:H-type small acid-soluble spore protein [Lederbergia wuyishanensis]|uniref:Small acid-soluble spore protein H (Minor) n=1 Tax=Lederbergia wuyishanensis TaxID=1347903 RepID=A0ABU0D9R1_9BACI|nr:H-type small acid-soluble spore protein [Lederbergia wuyishanensis]MCJ8007458.1 H-type small acid-soluble spore protein [Lederbergia wuyishanensis]MDQ0345103.1 small acid-soluble spore protein H (minor) [Lederbergia wuyishanensis]